jgi:arylsulfatase A-like enzyme
VAVDAVNVVVILTDDMRHDQMAGMPTVQSELVGQGMNFTKAFASMPLCCPARVTILRGQYAHTTGIYSNEAAYGGGLAGFQAAGLEDSTVATWLNDAGYRTGLVGKYLNGHNANTNYVPPGWDYWRGGNPGYYHPGFPDPYETDLINDYADEFIRTTSPSDPLFLYLSYFKPHSPSAPAPEHETDPRCDGITTSTIPSFDEPDIADKPTPIRSKAQMTPERVTYIGTTLPQDQCRALFSIDDGVSMVLDALADTNRLDNTLIFFLSDNGLFLGEHRLEAVKVHPYEEAIHIPFVVRYDPLTDGTPDTTHIVGNVDIAKTITDVVGIDPTPGCPTPLYRGGPCSGDLEGRTLVPALSGNVPQGTWREYFLIESHRACGVRGRQWVYVKWNTNEEELYNLAADPYQLTNLMDGSLTRQQRNKHDVMYAKAVDRCDPLPPAMTSI